MRIRAWMKAMLTIPGTVTNWESATVTTANEEIIDWKEQLVEYENLVYNHSLDSKTVNEMFSIAQ